MPSSESPEARQSFTRTGRVADGLLHRHWVRFVAELMLIVIGILVALSIDGWAQDREDRRNELAYLGVLSRDLDQMVEQLEVYIEFATITAESGAGVLRILSGDRFEEYTGELGLYLSSMSARRTLRLVSAAYTDLTSTGNLRLIRSRSLRDQLLRYFAEVARIELIIEKNNTAFVDQLYFPFILKMGLNWVPGVGQQSGQELGRADADMLELLEPGFQLPSDEALRQPPTARSWEEMRQMTVMRMRIATIGKTLARSLIEQTEVLKEAIEREIAAR
jgi:hypothetical protein